MIEDTIRQFGKYEIRDELGKGGFATVYRAYDTTLDREVALKILAPHLTWDPDFAERFHQEARIAAGLNHPNIVTIYEIGEHEGDLYIAMELIPGGTLQAHMQETGPMALDETVDMLGELADALDYAHSQDLIHRDVKPSNVLLKPTHHGSLRPVLADFGLVKVLARSTSATVTGAVVGTVEYMAPEQADSDRADELGPATDIYALGIVAYHMLTGQTPFAGSTVKVLMAHASKIPTPPVELRADLPVAVSDAILRVLAKDPADRFVSASAFVDALDAADAPKPRPTPPAAVPETPPAVSPPPPTLAQPVGPVTPPEQTAERAEPDSPAPVSPPPVPPARPPAEPEPEKSKRPIPVLAILAIVALAVILGGGRAVLRRINRQNNPTPVATTPAPTATEALAVAADTASPTPKPTATPLPGAPVVLDFSADPPSYVRGQENILTLSWEVESEGAVRIKIEGVDAEFSESASIELEAPEASTSYELTARNAGGETAAQVQVTVEEPLCRVNTGALNLRAGPGTSYNPPIRSYSRNTEMTPLSYYDGGFPEEGWIYVQVVGDGQKGWVRDSSESQFVACNVDSGRLPEATDIPPTVTPTHTFTPVPTPTPTITPTPTARLGYDISHFTATWVNEDEDGAMTRLIITAVDDETLSFHGYGKCTPNDCDWGEITVDFTPPTLTGVYEFGYKTMTLTVQRNGSQLRVRRFHDYVESDSRTDKTDYQTMNRQRVQINLTPLIVITITPQVIVLTPTP